MADFASVLNNIQQNIEPIQKLVTGGAYIAGIIFIFIGIYKLRVYGMGQSMMSGQKSLKPTLLALLTGTLLLYLPTSLDTFMQTTFGYESPLAYTTGGASYKNILNPLIRIIQLLGLISIIRSFLLLNKLGQAQNATVGRVAVHFFAGLAAFNIIGTYNIFRATLGL